MKLILSGCNGRMGRVITAMCAQNAEMQIVAGVDVNPEKLSDYPVFRDICEFTGSADCVIDFSNPAALESLLGYCTTNKTPIVLATTGYNEAQLEKINDASAMIPVFRSANMSLGVNVLCELVRMAARTREGFDIEIVEKHHRMKADSPSGTAIMLYDAVKKEKGPETEPVHGRYGRTEKRTGGEIGIHAVRGGTVTGEHEVGFYGNGEQLLLTHRAENRSLFAQGALKAASYVKDKPAGLYSMRDVVLQMLG